MSEYQSYEFQALDRPLTAEVPVGEAPGSSRMTPFVPLKRLALVRTNCIVVLAEYPKPDVKRARCLDFPGNRRRKGEMI
jgi:hypothetical protein